MVKFSYKFGDFVEVKTSSNSYKGKVITSKEKDVIFIKLENGYNIGISKKNVKNIKILKKFKEKKIKKNKVKVNSKLPLISILHTGGTISSLVDYETGAVTSRFRPEEIIAMFPELQGIVNIRSKLISNMFSEDLRFSHYNIMAKEVDKEIKKGAKGVIITHGTDTMHYTSAALSFILQDLPIPVLLVGAQRSSDRGSSDAGINLICAAKFITKTDFSGVAICMHESVEDKSCLILPGTKVRKLHSSRRDTFKAVNSKPIARVHKNGKIEFIKKDYKKKSNSKLKLKLINERLKIGVVRIHTNFYAEQLKPYEKFNGLVIEGTGLGHLPINKIDKFTNEHSKIFLEIKKLAKKMPVIMVTQTIFGRVNMNVYSTGRRLIEAGVLGNNLDMLPETAFIKLAWLLSNFNKKEVPVLIGKNFSGEINPRILKDEFLEFKFWD